MTYINKNDFLAFSGKDLEVEFKNGNYDIKDPVPMFLKRVETTAIAFLKGNFDNFGIESKIQNNLEQFKEGMLWQIDYILTNSELYNDPENHKSKYLCPVAKEIWRNIELINPIAY